MILMASPCILVRVRAPTTGSTGPRVGVVPLPGAEQKRFRMARLAPLVGPRVTRGRGCGPLGLSLHYIASSGADHGFHGSTGWGCSAPGRGAKRFSHGTACTTGRSTCYPWARMWPSWPLRALYCDFQLRPRVPRVHGLGLFCSRARSQRFFAWHGLHHW